MMLMAIGLLLSGHSAMGFSDPNHWIHRAVSLFEGEAELRRVILFPVYLGLMLRLLGSSLVFLCNLPFLGLLVIMSGWLAMRVFSFRRELSSAWRALAFVCGAGGLVYFQANRLSVMLNPYRDAPGMALSLLGWFLFLRGDVKKSKAWGFAAGLVCALSLGFRETMILAYIPVGVWTLVRLFQAVRNRRVWVWVGMMVLGGILGLLPTMVQNHLYSGYFFIPAYSASHIVKQAENVDVPEARMEREEIDKFVISEDLSAIRNQAEQRWMADRPTRLRFHPSRIIPGAGPEHFQTTFRKILKKFWRGYDGLLGVFILVALGVAVVKRNSVVLGLILPSFIITFLFYSSYRYVNWRYVFFLHLCLIPMIAAGLVELLWGLSRVRPKMRPGIGMILLVAVTLCFTGWSARRIINMDNNRMYAWDIPKFRESITPYLQEPRTFLGFYHHREMLAWFVDEGFNHSDIGSSLYPDTLEAEGLDAAMQRSADELRAALQEGHLYFHELHHLPKLLPFWADIQAVVDLGTFPTKPYRYGKPMEYTLYEVMPWVHNEFTFSIPLDTPSIVPKVLVINMQRIWDDRQRERAELWLNDHKWVNRLKNGVQFIPLPEPFAGEIEARVSSDAPISSEVPHKLWKRNEPFVIPLGMRSDWWYRELISPEIQQKSGLRRDGVLFGDQGEFRLPVFANEDHDVYAEFRVEFVCSDGGLRSQRLNLYSGSGVQKRSMNLPQQRTTARFMVPLGPGSGELEFRNIQLDSDLPPMETQRGMIGQGTLQSQGFIKVYDVQIISIPRHAQEKFEWSAGDRLSGVSILGGLHEPEVYLGKWGTRWSDGHARIQLPESLTSDQPGTLEVRYFDSRPELVASPVELRIGDKPLSNVTLHREGTNGMHTLSVKIDSLPDVDSRVLEILSTAWSPYEVMNTPDFRTLGLMVHAVSWEPEGD
jgi:hypothetical protein